MDKFIIGLSGKLGSGKDTLSNWVIAQALTHGLNLVPYAYVNEDGKLVAPLNAEEEAELNVDSREPLVQAWFHERVFPLFKPFSFAEPLKDFCTNVLGASVESIWQDKTLETSILWENFPQKGKNKKSGPMTGRQIQEQIGEFVRQLNPDGWVNALKLNVENYGSTYSLVRDVRRRNEAEVIHSMGGKLVRLTRITENAEKNNDISNTDLDNYENWDKVIDNQNQTLEETLTEFRDYLIQEGWFNVVEAK